MLMHTTAQQFHYMSECAIKLRDIGCVDDKGKIDYGEPDRAILSGVQEKNVTSYAATFQLL